MCIISKSKIIKNNDVIFSNAGAVRQPNTLLGVPTSIRSLTTNDPAPVGIGGSSTLTFSSTLGAASPKGITVAANSGDLTIRDRFIETHLQESCLGVNRHEDVFHVFVRLSNGQHGI